MCKGIRILQYIVLVILTGAAGACTSLPQRVPANTMISTETITSSPLGERIHEQCPQQIRTPLPFTYEGGIVFLPFQDPHLYNLQTGQGISFPPGNIAANWSGWQFIGSSQNRNWFYYIGPATLPQSRASGWVVGRDGKKASSFETPPLVINTYWVNSETILFVTPGPTVTLLNPFSIEWTNLELGISDLYNIQPSATWSFAVDPSVKNVIYPPDSKTGHFRYALYNIDTGKIVWEKNSDFAPFKPPKWSPEGHQFIVIDDTKDLHTELVLVSESGQETRLTNFEAFFPIHFIYNFNWSPDGTKVAFWLDTRTKFDEESPQKHLTVVDMTNRETTQFCITTLYDDGEAPIWSPDSQKLILRVKREDHSGKNLLIDLIKNIAFDLPTNSPWPPVDWLNSN